MLHKEKEHLILDLPTYSLDLEMELEETVVLWSYLTPKEIQKLRERRAYHSSVLRIKEAVGAGKKIKSLMKLAAFIGYDEYYLHQAFAESHMKSGRYYWSALFRTMKYLRHKVPDILVPRYNKWLAKQENQHADFSSL